jgi:glycosyltransferase involved in cell wall biosynthesis
MQRMSFATDSHAVVHRPRATRRPWHVAVVTETYPPEVNGVAATIARLVCGLHDRGHELQLVRPRQHHRDTAGAEERLLHVLMPGLPVPRYPQLKMGLPARRALVALWAAHRPDVVHVVTEGPLGWSALQAAAQLGVPVVSDFRTNFHAYCSHYGLAWLRGPITAYLRRFHNRTACTMVPTESLRSELAAIGFKRLKVVSRGVDTRLFDPSRRSAALRQAWGAGHRTPVVLYVGRLAAEKNLDLLLTAFEALRGQVPGARLVLVGDGPDRAQLAQRCPGAVFAGMRHGEDLATHYASADLFLFPSVTETFGNVVPEAMASGLAVLGFDYAAAGQLIRHGENGLLARLGDRESFCDVARGLADDLPRARALGAQARLTAGRLDWGRIVDAVEAEYSAAMHDTAGAPLPTPQPRHPDGMRTLRQDGIEKVLAGVTTIEEVRANS